MTLFIVVSQRRYVAHITLPLCSRPDCDSAIARMRQTNSPILSDEVVTKTFSLIYSRIKTMQQNLGHDLVNETCCSFTLPVIQICLYSNPHESNAENQTRMRSIPGTTGSPVKRFVVRSFGFDDQNFVFDRWF